ncbi:hypothetical protein [Robertkochia flava]|uniref:hypothetical protein n=1 Tax=Robertkochia flava TaxID=3447986 RepID=UPI001CCA1457|nr:hypothetical protein [Robertkochia marina]
MKSINKILSLSLLALLGSCVESDNAIDELFDNTERGAALRTLSVNNPDFSISDPSSVFSVTLEEQDYEMGDLLESVDVYVSFTDNTPGKPDDTDYSKPEAFVETVPASAFASSSQGLPSITYELSFGDALAAVGLTDEFAGGDYFDIRFALNLTDGRTFTNTDGNGNIFTGSFFQSPFIYRSPIVCPATFDAPTPGTWTIDGQDSYGDGWNGASIDVLIDGEQFLNFLVSEEQGSSNSVTFEVPADATSIEIFYNSGAWDSEVTFQVTSANGNTVLDLGPSPSAGVSLIDYCNSDL